jgi:hypothetical protein
MDGLKKTSPPTVPPPRTYEPTLASALHAASKLLAAKPGGVFLRRELELLVAANRQDWSLPSGVTTEAFIAGLEQATLLREVVLQPVPGSKYQPFVRYAWGTPSPFSMALSLKAGSYLSHGSAVFLRGLSDQIPKNIYVNKEQSPKPAPAVPPSQESIDRAFQNEPRVSNYQFEFDGFRATLLSGKNTGRLEVTGLTDAGVSLDVTKLERTLIDITVRPVYAGGVFEVLTAYRAARDRVSVNTLIATLKRLEYAYPYHQAIGFYMERAGFAPKQLDKLRSIGMPFRFYLTNRMHNPKLSEDWQLFFPEGL